MIAIIGGEIARFRPLVDLYRKSGQYAGHAAESLKVGVHAIGFLAETTQDASNSFYPGWQEMFAKAARERGWPPATRARFDELVSPRGAFLVGDPESVTAKILSANEDLGGIDRLTFQMSSAAGEQQAMIRSIELLGKEVRPKVRASVARSVNPLPL
jgi:alkanesulfonate monooxygenase SsuD/methylene tetrahydromethanopterin reductase-like flavin-dependent oxidoreductase (luciferase family)